ncbi:MAG: histidine kinase, partial [Casimicrobiaceae bacterium]
MTASIPRTCSKQGSGPGPVAGGHPLEMFPVFRRIPRSVPRDLVYTLIWNQMFALVFTAFNVAVGSEQSVLRMFWIISVFSNCIGYLIHFTFLIGDRLLPGIHAKSLTARAVYYSIIPLAGVFAGYWLGAMILDYESMRAWIFSARGALSVATVSLIISGVLLSIFIPRERAARLQADVVREQARVSVAEKQATLAQLKLLEAQVEPHFLYNTLANIVSLIDADPATA